MQPTALQYGSVIQIKPESDTHFGGCLMTVTETKDWGAQGFVKIPGESGLAYYRCKFENMEYVGHMAWNLVPEENSGLQIDILPDVVPEEVEVVVETKKEEGSPKKSTKTF
jgi:hypothetical protein